MNTADDCLATKQPTTRAPHCVLMAAMPGSGKTQLAQALAAHGMVRLCPDEEMFRRHGRYGVDFPRGQFRVRERPILDDLAVDLRNTLSSGKDVVFDHGFWTPAERAEWRTIILSAGGVPMLVHLPVPHDVRWSRIRERNRNFHTDPNAIYFSEEDLRRFATRFVPPGEDEPHLVYDGNPGTVISAMQSGQDGRPSVQPEELQRAGRTCLGVPNDTPE
ncbi:ATP/GTP-binding protein [Streptomyces carminius]|uniref:ATP/GTP-binding protein n=1 Tax=Streptomyces carminius TaxID=2665496 RepID=A0A2M8LYZ4_9ACTN|nr:ATP-binding protein [Streptomyces carminius]PJE97161.1 ATP/GTP-binding protein [Streptomyces carminius]